MAHARGQVCCHMTDKKGRDFSRGAQPIKKLYLLFNQNNIKHVDKSGSNLIPLGFYFATLPIHHIGILLLFFAE